MWHDVGALADFQPGQIRVVNAGDKEIGVVRWDDSVRAVRTVCPHQLASLSTAIVRPRLRCDGPLSRVEADSEAPTISCPWHGWEFDLSNGRPIWDPKGPGLRTYPTEIRGDRVVVDIGGGHATE